MYYGLQDNFFAGDILSIFKVSQWVFMAGFVVVLAVILYI